MSEENWLNRPTTSSSREREKLNWAAIGVFCHFPFVFISIIRTVSRYTSKLLYFLLQSGLSSIPVSRSHRSTITTVPFTYLLIVSTHVKAALLCAYASNLYAECKFRFSSNN
ncbi:hypothetical protein OUZ56_015346 [Daphnia magna]|uniref:Transmembrane protein n=1 Tax=Daphnia magna TaxID=35525 RepID=A0ABR0AMJ5_9CRUS|nr:hypothetical protein OUZ56_015346 [Daphnia magna]